MSKILFICEGETTERKFCNLIIEKYFIKRKKQKEFVAFKTNIYSLYEELKKDPGLEIVPLIIEKAKKNNDLKTLTKFNNENFPEVYLIFDFDPQAPEYSEKKITEMLEYFDEETEKGKLYINYPMIESLKHFKSLPDKNYNTYSVTKEECNTYKEDVSKISIINHFSSITEEKLKTIIKQNLEKYAILLNCKLDNYINYKTNFSQLKLLHYQINNLKNHNKIQIMNTSIFWGLDYFKKDMFNSLIN